MRITAEWLRFHDWVKRNKDHEGRMAKKKAPEGGGAPPMRRYPVLSERGLDMAWRRLASTKEGGVRLYATSEMPREATQELADWGSPDVMGRLFRQSQSEEVVPEMRAASGRASGRLDMGAEEGPTLVDGGEVGRVRRTASRERSANIVTASQVC